MKAFTYEYYRNLLDELKTQEYEFIFFDDLISVEDPNKKVVLLRHDIDFDPEKALKLAEIEKENNVSSTFFFLLNSVFYNVHSVKILSIINKIIAYGHSIGVHFDTSSYEFIDKSFNLQKFIKKEIDSFEKLFKYKISTISFHRPTTNILLNNISIPFRHTYEEIYTKKVKYLSDSKKQMSEGDILQIIRNSKYKKMQLLIHPIWWSEKSVSSDSDYNLFVKRKIIELEQAIVDNSKIYKLKKGYKWKKYKHE